MLDRIRRRLTLGYVGIFALILALLGAAVTVSFWGQASAQQDELLRQRAHSTLDFVSSALLAPEPGGPGREDPGGPGPGPPQGPEGSDAQEDGPVGPIRSATDADVGLVALSPGDGGRVLEESPSASSLGLPFEGAARRAADAGRATEGTFRGPGGEAVRVVSVPVPGPGERAAVVQAAQPRRAVHERVRDLVLVLASVGLGGLALAAVGGLFMSRRAMRPVEDAFGRQRAFIADASHELKTPLALVKIGAEVVRRGPTDPGNAEVVEDQLAEIDRMDALLSDLLTLARLDAGRLEVEDKPFDLAIVAAEAADRFLTRAAEEGVRLEVDLPEELPARGDRERAAQVLAPLLDNAVRHTPKGGTVTVSGRALDGRAEASVSDTGPGIAPEVLGRVFDRFYRAEEARTRAPCGGGTGLGLAIARDLARHMGGDLTAHNAPGTGGAVFRLDLPGQ